MKGDRVEVVIDSGEGTQTYEIAATKAGRRVDIANRRGIIEVSEVTRTGSWPAGWWRWWSTRPTLRFPGRNPASMPRWSCSSR